VKIGLSPLSRWLTPIPPALDVQSLVPRVLREFPNLQEVVVMVTEGVQVTFTDSNAYAPSCRHPFWRSLFGFLPRSLYCWVWPPIGLHQALCLLSTFVQVDLYPRTLRLECTRMKG
jgi:hypothetical protein